MFKHCNDYLNRFKRLNPIRPGGGALSAPPVGYLLIKSEKMHIFHPNLVTFPKI